MEEGSSERHVAAIILAAGPARRMGQLKQLLVYRGRTLLQHSIDQAVGAGFEPIIVVAGSAFQMLHDSIAGQPVEMVQNENWQSGMGSSIIAGMQALVEEDEVPFAVAI